MSNKCLLASLNAFFLTFGSGALAAQSLDLSHLAGANMAFDQAMMQQAQDFSAQWFQNVQAWRARTGDYTTPVSSGFDASTLNAANLANSRAFESQNSGWWANQNRYANIHDNQSRATRGYAQYADRSGNVYNLPYTHNTYWTNGNGYAIGSNDGASPFPQTYSNPLYGYGW